jgi:hypothetical protein
MPPFEVRSMQLPPMRFTVLQLIFGVAVTRSPVDDRRAPTSRPRRRGFSASAPAGSLNPA